MTRRNSPDGIALGILLVFGLHIVALLAYFALLLVISWLASVLSYPPILKALEGNYYFLIPLFFPGLVQLVYVVPLALRMRRRGNTELMKGVIVAAVLTALLNGSCFLWLYVASMR
jgi:hypothetical protein